MGVCSPEAQQHTVSINVFYDLSQMSRMFAALTGRLHEIFILLMITTTHELQTTLPVLSSVAETPHEEGLVMLRGWELCVWYQH